MGNIVLLDDLTINKIAAGEVIERPASVIKEMVENSIDAGATNISVEIRNGGISYIRIVDNGKGIAEDDLELAFERHATSKIRVADDLQNVMSMGFRGEALASIAAVANVELISKTEEQEIGYRVEVEGGNLLAKEEAACSTGTIITVQNLFFNTPVRYKFLKKDYTESGYIEDVIIQIALVHPEIAFKLTNSGKTIIQTTGNGNIKEVIYSIYGKEVAEAIIETEYKYEDIIVKGIVGKPEIARSNRSRQIFFVNKRYIKDKTLSAAVTEAFKGMIPIGKFGFVILNIEMNPSKVDVNVHPAKLEVRFEEENVVFKAVYHAIKDALLKSELVANTSKNEENGEPKTMLVESKKDERTSGLFSWRKKKKEEIDDEIEKIGERDNIISQIYNGKQEEKQKINEKENNSMPIDTFNVLEQLKQLQDKMQKDVEDAKKEIEHVANKETVGVAELNKNITLEEEKTDYSINAKNEKEIADFSEIAENDKTDSLKEMTENFIKPDSNEEINQQTSDENELPKAIINMKEEGHEPENADNKELEEEVAEVKSKIDEILETTNEEMPVDFAEMYYKIFGTMPKMDDNIETTSKVTPDDTLDAISTDSNMSVFDNLEEENKPKYRFIGIAFKTYIIIEMNKELYMLDQHAAHERVLYEKIKNNYYSGEVKKNSQLMLLPDLITLTHKEMDIAKDNIAMFERAGFILEEFGENTFKLSGVPEICIDLDTKELFLETLDEINSIARTAKQEIEERFIATVACKSAIKAGMTLSINEVDELLNKLLVLPNPFTCPHGRPIAIKMSQYDLERKFARK